MTDTIFAPATPAGRSAIAVIRISGPAAGMAVESLAGRRPRPRTAVLCKLRLPRSGEHLDDALVLWMPGPRSYTGEDVAELHLHGSRAVVRAAIDALQSLGLRLAEPGEFTRRAFDAGKLDLTQVEALADLIDAETTAQRRQALRQLEGEIGRRAESWREALTRVLAKIEAAIDFPDEDLPAGIEASLKAPIQALRGEIADALADGGRGERLRDGYRIAILGLPNVGKSSFLNMLAKREAAIVSTFAGTTRDVIEVHLDLAGYPVLVADTAGLRESPDPIEAEGVRRAEAWARQADLRLAVVAADEADRLPALLCEAEQADDIIVALNKVDLVATVPERIAGRRVLPVSAKTGAGIDGVVEALVQRVRSEFGETGGLVTRARHRQALTDCEACLGRALAVDGSRPEILAEELRLAARALGRLLGRIDIEDLLDVIFREFCIGK